MTGISDECELGRRELTRRLMPYLSTEQAWAIAHAFIADMLARGWRPPLERPPPPSRRGDYQRGAALARELLAKPRHQQSRDIERQYD
ncbi:hypothetical protein ACFWYW_14535 [Nonomuraea sp. NPDC059023]|uniref:hypothetical protein n=1 Tax=unclassified Nonomuraea TaxID=2593643 RepID=UPI0036981C55